MNATGGWIAEPRARRAVAVIALAVMAIVVAGIVYLHPSLRNPGPHRVLVGAAASPTPPQLDARLSALYDFVSPELGWALVTEANASPPQFWVFKTGDGAKHWAQQLAGRCGGLGLSNLRMFDASHGEVDLCEPVVVYRTADGGAVWAPMALPPYSAAVLDFGDYLHAWYLAWGVSPAPPPVPGQPADAAQTIFLSTADGGANWTRLPAPPSPSFSGKGGGFNLHFSGSEAGWMGTDLDPATVYSTIDGGFSWRPWRLPPAAVSEAGTYNTEVRLLPGDAVMAVTYDLAGNIKAFTTSDAGLSWRQIAPPPGNTTYDNFVFVDPAHWWAMRNSVLYKSSDAGQSWKAATLLLDQWDYHPQPIDAKHAWAGLTANFDLVNPGPPAGRVAVPGGGLAMTSDGGMHWSYLQVPRPGLS